MTSYFNNDVRTLHDACTALMAGDVRTLYANDPDARKVAGVVLSLLCDTLSGVDGGRMGGHPLIKIVAVCDECDEDIWCEFSYHNDGDKIVHDGCCVTCNSNPFHKD